MKLLLRPCAAALLLAAPVATLAQNVGIGTPAPTQKLDVNGGLRLRALSGDGLRLPQVQADGTLTTAAPGLYDVAAPAGTGLLAPVGAALPTGSYPFGVAVNGGRAYVTNLNDNTLQAYDVSNPAIAPVPVGAPVPTGSGPLNVAAAGGRVYVPNYYSNTLQAYSVGQPARSLVVQADGSLGTASPALLSLSGQTLSIGGGNAVTLPTPTVAQLTLAGTTPAGASANMLLLHGLPDPSKIVGITAVAAASSGDYIPPSFTGLSGGNFYTVYVVGPTCASTPAPTPGWCATGPSGWC